MTKNEFKIFLSRYKEFSDLSKEIFKKEYPEEEILCLYIKDRKIMIETESKMNFDITKLVLSELLPDDLVF